MNLRTLCLLAPSVLFIGCNDNDCDPGYTGSDCSECAAGWHAQDDGCAQDEECLASTCNEHGTCAAQGGLATCTCSEGFAGKACDSCADGYTGSDCSECAAGWHAQVGGCAQDEECLPTTCSGHGTCALQGGLAICTCGEGYAGKACDGCADGYADWDKDGTCAARPKLTNFTTAEELVKLREDKACLVIIAHDQTKVYGDPLPQLTFTLEGACLESGKLDAAKIKQAITLTTTVTQSATPGSYPINVQIDESALPLSVDHIAVSAGTVRVPKAQLVVQADTITLLKADPEPANYIPAVTYQIRGLKLGDKEDVVKGLQFRVVRDLGYFATFYCLIPGAVAPAKFLGQLYDPRGNLGDPNTSFCLPEAEIAPADRAGFREYRMGFPPIGPPGTIGGGVILLAVGSTLDAGPNYFVHYLPGGLYILDPATMNGIAIETMQLPPVEPGHPGRFFFPKEAQLFMRFAANRYREDRSLAVLPDAELDAWLAGDAVNLDGTLTYVAGYLSADNWSMGGYKLPNGTWATASAELEAARTKMGDYVLEAARHVRRLELQNEKDLFIQWRDVDRYQQYTSRFMSLFGPPDTPPGDLGERAAAQTAIGLAGTVASAAVFVATGTSIVATLTAAGGAAGLFAGFSTAATTVSAATVAVSATAATAAAVGGAIGAAILAVVVAGVKIWQLVEVEQMEAEYNERIAAVDTTPLTDISNAELTLAITFMRASQGPSIALRTLDPSWLVGSAATMAYY